MKAIEDMRHDSLNIQSNVKEREVDIQRQIENAKIRQEWKQQNLDI